MVKLILTGADDGVGEVKQNLRQHGGETKTGSQVSLELKFPLGKKLWSVSVWLFLRKMAVLKKVRNKKLMQMMPPRQNQVWHAPRLQQDALPHTYNR